MTNLRAALAFLVLALAFVSPALVPGKVLSNSDMLWFQAPWAASTIAPRSVMSETSCSSPGRSSATGTTSRQRTAQPRSGSPPRSTVPIRPAAPVSRTRLMGAAR